MIFSPNQMLNIFSTLESQHALFINFVSLSLAPSSEIFWKIHCFVPGETLLTHLIYLMIAELITKYPVI